LLDFLFQFASIDLFHGDSITHYAVIFKYLVAEVIEMDPYLAEAYGFRGMAYFVLEDYQDALDDFNNALALEPELQNVYFFRALYFYKMKLYEMAIKDFTSVIEIDKHFGEAYLYRGFCKGMIDDLKGATYDMIAAAQLGIPEAQKNLNEKGIPW